MVVVVVGSNQEKTKSLFSMEKERGTTGATQAESAVVVVEDIEEGEISDDSDLKEISESDFKEQESSSSSSKVTKQQQQQPKTEKEKKKDDSSSSASSRVWMTRDLYNYSVSSNYGSSFHNLAWAQAVQNKPLNEVLNFGRSDDDENNTNKSLTSSKDNKICNVIIDDSSEDEADCKLVEKEEGELEEGEIGFDSEQGFAGETKLYNGFQMLVKEFEWVTKNVAQKPFGEVCSKLTTSFESLQSMALENGVSALASLIRQSFAGIEALNSVFCSFNPELKKQNRDVFSRLLSHVKSQNPVMFSSDQMKEIETFISSLESESASSNADMEIDMEIDEEVVQITTEKKQKDSYISGGKPNNQESRFLGEKHKLALNSLKKGVLEPIQVNSLNRSDANIVSMSLKPGLPSGPRGRAGFGPLLDLHRDHDVDSLPSPTREAPPPFYLQKQNDDYSDNLPSPTPKSSLLAPKPWSPTPKPSSPTPIPPCPTSKSSYTTPIPPSPTPKSPSPTPKSPLPTPKPSSPTPISSSPTPIPPSPTPKPPSPTPNPSSPTPKPSLLMPKPSSPTPKPSLPTQKPFDLEKQLDVEKQLVGDSVHKQAPTPITANKVDDIMRPYESGGATAVSSYQQKFARTPYFYSSELPSPTPSDDGDKEDGNASEEVSSSSVSGDARTANPPVPSHPVGSGTQHMDSSSVQGVMPAKVGQLVSGLNAPVKVYAKSRDPRLRFANSEANALSYNKQPMPADTPKVELNGEINSSRKHKNEVEPLVDGHMSKRPRNGFTSSGVHSDVIMIPRTGTLNTNDRIQSAEILGTSIKKSDNADTLSDQRQDSIMDNFNVKMVGNEQFPVTSTSPPVIFPNNFLKDIAVNPTMLLQLLLEQQQKLAADAQNKSSNSVQSTPALNSSIITGTVPFVNATAPKTSEITAGTHQFATQATSTNLQSEWGKIRMKPRDPRRVLHSSTFQKSESLGPEQFRINTTQASKDNLKVRQQGEQAQTTSLPSQSIPPPDISWQFTNKLQNLANIMSSHATSAPSVVPQNGSSQPIKVDMMADSKGQQSGTSLSPEGVVGPPRSQQSWGDVEHLFEGYDDQQKAAIQRERARRIEEQNKMFSARKLCLVLDLDHTLLNSAKFNEVDPVHDEILRKKEEQDREKLQRHLFRFPHMGMWTKLRPGVWNFLEKACRLYELHLYTMGNKLYATEMAKVLDPTGVLFSGRVISRGDEAEPFDGDEKVQPKSKDLEGVLGMESSVVIIDDSVKVWPHNRLNLILVERYTYFPCSRRQFGLPGPSLLEIDHDERPEDGTLASSLAVIERIHHNFFSHPSFHELDVRNILASEQQRILAGCCILFSRIFPVGQANPQQHPLWQTAQQFGAVCTTQIDDRVTHVVASSLGTDKVNWALSTGRFVVHPGWVEASALLYRRANELDFIVKQNLP